MPRGNAEVVEVARGVALTESAVVRVTTPFPLGEAWIRMMLRINIALTVGTGAGPISEGELKFIKSIRLVTDRGENLYNNVPGRLIYRLDAIKSKTVAAKDAIAAATATYRVHLNLHFIDKLMNVPEDTILNTARYSSITLEVGVGTVADLFTAPGTATETPTMDVYIERQKGRLPKPIAPQFFQEVGFRGPIDPNSLLTIDLERAANLAYKRLLAFTGSGVGLLVGVPFSGTADSAVINELTLDVDSGPPIDRVLADVLNRMNKQEYSLEAVMVGWYIEDFVKDGSLNSSLYSGDKSRLTQRVTLAGGAANPAQLSLGYEGWRPLF